jgi:DNA-binding transcriptional ArsR family regulator
MNRPATQLEVLKDPGRVAAMLPEMRRRILANLREPDSAAGLSRRLGMARQKINYHLRRLEEAGLVECVAKRRRRGCVERLLRPTARAFVISPAVLEGLTADPGHVRDRFSSTYLMTAASNTMRDVGVLRERAEAAGKRLVTLTMQTDLCFASPADLGAFADEMRATMTRLVAKYHQPDAPGSRAYRFLFGGHPAITKSPEEAASEAAGRRHETEKEDT